MEMSGLWVEMRNTLDPELDGNPAELLRWLDDEALPERMALGWLRRLALLIPKEAVPLVSVLRQAEADLQYRAERLACLRWEAVRQIDDPNQQPPDFRDYWHKLNRTLRLVCLVAIWRAIPDLGSQVD